MKALRLLPILLLSIAFAADKATVAELLKDEKLDGKAVTVIAKVFDFERKTSKIGKDYVRFKLGSEKEYVRVYAQVVLDPAPKEGDSVEVTGKFARERNVGDMKIRNEIDASPKREKGFGVKLVKSAK